MPNPSFEDELLNYAKSQKTSSSGSWGDYIFGSPRTTSSLITNEDDSTPNVAQRFSKWYNETPYAGKQFDWVGDMNRTLDKGESAMAGYIGKWPAKVVAGPARSLAQGAEMFAGSPADIASSVAAPVKEGLVALKGASKVPAMVRTTLPYIAKGVGYTGRALDALQATYAGANTIEAARQGNYGQALVNASGAVLNAAGATGYEIPKLKSGKEINLADEVAATRTPSFIQSDPKFASRPVTPPVATPAIDPNLGGKVVTIDGSMPVVKAKGKAAKAPAETLVTPPVQTQAEIDATNNLVRLSQEPLRFARPVTAPNAITDPAFLLPERSGVPVAPATERSAAVVHPNDVWLNRGTGTVDPGEVSLHERATRDLTAAGEEINARNLERYRDVEAYRNRIQTDAAKAGKPGGYEAAVSSEQVTPATEAPNYPAEMAPETRTLLDAAKGKVDDEVAARVTKAVYDGTKNIPGHHDPTFPIGQALVEQLGPDDLNVARSIGLLDETHLRAVKNAQDRAAAIAERQAPPIALASRQAVAGLDSELPLSGATTEAIGDIGDVGESTAPAGPTRFKTEQGSVYQHFDDGTTIRDKAARAEHPGDEGVKDRSSRTYYVDPKELPLIDALGTRTGKDTNLKIRERPDGSIGLWYERGKVKGFMKHHKEGGFVTPAEGPKVGLVPVEVFADGSHHFGNKITEVGPDPTTWRADTSTEKPYRYGDDPKLDRKNVNKVNRVLRDADKELAAITDPAERRIRLVEILGEKLTRNELGAAFEGKILNQKLVGEATTNRISRGIEESAMVPHTPALDETPGIGPANQMPPSGFAGRPVTAPTASGPMYWNQQSPEPISVHEGTFAGAPAQTPPQVLGSRQVFAQAAGETAKPVERSIEDVLQALKERGVTEPSVEQVQKIMSNPRLLDNLIPPTQEFVPDVSRGFRPVEPPQTNANRMIPERVPVDTGEGRIMSPEQATAAIEKARKSHPRDIYADNDWERAQEVVRNLGHEDLAQGMAATAAHIRKQQMGLAEEARKSGAMSMETEMQRLGNAGDEFILLKRQANTEAVRRWHGYTSGVADEVRALSDDRFSKVAEWLDGDKTIKLSAPELATAEKMREVLKRSGKDQVDRGMLSKGAVTEYWPRRFDGVPEQTIVEKMRAKNMSQDQIDKALEAIRKQREMKTAGEYNRSGNDVPGFRTDKEVFFDHLREVSKRIELADRFGLKDIADPNSPASKLVAATSDPERARDLAQRILRGGPQGTEKTRRAANIVRNYAHASMMQLSAVANTLGGTLPVAFRGDLKSAGQALFKVFDNGSPEMKFMKSVNGFHEFQAGVAEGLTDNRFTSKLNYGINATQNQVNKYAGATGVGTARGLFSELKSNPNDKDIGWLLQDLVNERPATLLKQKELTQAQLESAMIRMVDITQGIAHNEKLPYAWVRSGLGTIPQIFQRINFQVSKTLKDGVMHSPMNRGGKLGAVAKLGALGIGLGEAINIGKEIPKTVGQVGTNTVQQFTGDTTEDKDFLPTLMENSGWGEKGADADRYYQTKRWISGLNKKAGENGPLVHAVNNLESSFAIGMPLNILGAYSSTFLADKNVRDPGGSALNNMFFAVDEGGKLMMQAGDTAYQVARPLWGEKGDFHDTARFVTRRLPIPGGVQSGVVREISTNKQAEKGGGSGSVWGNPEDFK